MNTLDNLFHQGGPLFMGILTVLLALLLLTTVVLIIYIVTGKANHLSNFRHRITYLKSMGLFTMITGILGQLMGLMLAFGAIERAGDISPADGVRGTEGLYVYHPVRDHDLPAVDPALVFVGFMVS